MSYYSGGAFNMKSPETPQEAVDRLWIDCDSVLEFITKLTRCDWHDIWEPEEFKEFNRLVLKKLTDEIYAV